ncbi:MULTISPECIES: hypothetical protein [Escherichia]|uniref:Uncharacterized protein n=1 Tax=Escherichia coli TaxID=562 RepID=A0A2W6QWI6_ECOLX|nr:MULTISPECIES: hypothetical protein [Escherichia]EEU9398678.1 hypothetical protein [Escherichia coli]EEV6177128.1 hypothetical protein [Escherichia coli]EEV9199206.1 hypothetical protein [Escherichia coli]EEW6056960.1 hypothetical protein [Escherichia coli]EEZ7634514.1 hypothetical protein [Escherichia coli]
MISAKIIIYPSREYPVKSGYRPLFLINGEYYSGVVSFDGDDIYPNEERNVKIKFLTFNGALNHGDVIKLFESPNHEVGRVLVN